MTGRIQRLRAEVASDRASLFAHLDVLQGLSVGDGTDPAILARA